MSRSPLACADRSGFLFAHPCDRPAVGACHRCGRPICVEHTRLAAGGPTCIACLREDESDRDHGSDRDTTRTSDSGAAAASPEAAGMATGGQYGGAGATEGWDPGAEGARVAQPDDPFLSPVARETAYYDVDDFRAFDAPAAAAAADAADAADAAETDTGAS